MTWSASVLPGCYATVNRKDKCCGVLVQNTFILSLLILAIFESLLSKLEFWFHSIRIGHILLSPLDIYIGWAETSNVYIIFVIVR